MRSDGYEMEYETYGKVLRQFCDKKMIKDAKDLYEFAMVLHAYNGLRLE